MIKFLLLISLSLSACSSAGQSPSKCIDRKYNRVIAFGDSITQGFIKLDGTNYGYVYAFAQKINLPLVNYGVSGSRLEEDAQITKILNTKLTPYDIVLFLPGRNDANIYRLDSVYLSKYKNLLYSTLNYMATSNACIIVGTTLKEANEYIVPDKVIKVYGDILTEVLSTPISNVILIDSFDLFPSNTNLLTDSIHPNELGSVYLANLFLTGIN